MRGKNSSLSFIWQPFRMTSLSWRASSPLSSASWKQVVNHNFHTFKVYSCSLSSYVYYTRLSDTHFLFKSSVEQLDLWSNLWFERKYFYYCRICYLLINFYIQILLFIINFLTGSDEPDSKRLKTEVKG